MTRFEAKLKWFLKLAEGRDSHFTTATMSELITTIASSFWEAGEFASHTLLAEKDAEIERLQDKLTYINLEPCAHCKESEEAVERAIASRNYEADQRVSAEKKVAIAVKGLGLISMTADFCSIGRVREYAEKALKEMK